MANFKKFVSALPQHKGKLCFVCALRGKCADGFWKSFYCIDIDTPENREAAQRRMDVMNLAFKKIGMEVNHG